MTAALRPRRRRRPRASALLAALLLGLLAGIASCQTEGGSGPATPYNGFWYGTTSHGDFIQFQVASDRLSDLKFEHTENGCTWRMTSWNLADGILIGNGAFVYQVDELDFHKHLEGSFTSPSTAEGGYSFRGFGDKGTTCVNRGEGTFTANWVY
jgi:hypothetical protein